MIRAYKPPMICRPLSVTVGMLVSLLLNHSAYTQTSTFSTPGTYTWVCPAGVNTINVDLYGAGGGGGYGGSSNGQGGGGGGGGGFSSRASIPVSCGVSYTIVVGTGGTGGTATVAAGSGSLTSATFGAIVVTASGGSGGNNYSIGGAGGGWRHRLRRYDQ